MLTSHQISSGVWADKIPLSKAHELKEIGSGGLNMKKELQRIGYLGDLKASYEANPIGVLAFQSYILKSNSRLITGLGTLRIAHW